MLPRFFKNCCIFTWMHMHKAKWCLKEPCTYTWVLLQWDAHGSFRAHGHAAQMVYDVLCARGMYNLNLEMLSVW